jgi:hypothetical protein
MFVKMLMEKCDDNEHEGVRSASGFHMGYHFCNGFDGGKCSDEDWDRELGKA